MPISRAPELIHVRKTITFTGGAGLGAVGAVPIFTTTGSVNVALVMGRCTTSLTSAGGGTLALGVTGSTALFIAATTGTALTSTNSIWMTTTPTAAGLAAPAAVKDIVITADLIGTVAVAGITAGVVEFEVYYLPLQAGSGLA